ncbi:RdgB/HAM1 family non-canonical purine NTP pyrophosphatase [Cohaesibacter intestini]|uniref:RdgB/HAM1 family non-canonical purine NTP pyrophosphatase n=1 Tax=Cohaesibacter intestini TaxID=2211145 RepID=UPI000DEA74C6|nr:RdgB/HAM1 family non-canonical purine NTP pyrophosphatase [Cohaesibacter intestini]
MSNQLSVDTPLVVASHNKGKIREIQELLAHYGLSIKTAAELELDEPEETGTTFEANAELKALAAAKATGLPALADDSGFAVDALDGDPGIYSARWAGPAKDFALAMRNVEEKLQAKGAIEPKDRTGRFIAVLCLAWPDGETQFFRGEVAGEVIWPPRGDKGFGYDPMFIPEGHDITFGEMTSEQKHGWKPGGDRGLSHRSRAFKLFSDACLESFLK